MAEKCSEFDFSGMTDLGLIVLQHSARRFPEDKAFVDAVLIEIGRRQKEKGVKKRSKAKWR